MEWFNVCWYEIIVPYRKTDPNLCSSLLAVWNVSVVRFITLWAATTTTKRRKNKKKKCNDNLPTEGLDSNYYLLCIPAKGTLLRFALAVQFCIHIFLVTHMHAVSALCQRGGTNHLRDTRCLNAACMAPVSSHSPCSQERRQHYCSSPAAAHLYNEGFPKHPVTIFPW